jgi:hypothetical protein
MTIGRTDRVQRPPNVRDSWVDASIAIVVGEIVVQAFPPFVSFENMKKAEGKQQQD